MTGVCNDAACMQGDRHTGNHQSDMGEEWPSESEVDQIERLRRIHVRPGMTAGEFAVHLPDHLRSTYWHSKIEQLCREERIDADDEARPVEETR